MSTVGYDNRTPEYRPEGKIGRLVADIDDKPGFTSFGTATLVGRFTAITNAHVVEQWNKGFSNPRFEAGLAGETALDRIPVSTWTWSNENPGTAWRDDFAIITFDEPIGDRLGWYGFSKRAINSTDFAESVTMRGYSEDLLDGDFPSVAGGLAFGDLSGNQDWRHDLDSFSGSSGSAIVSNTDGKVLGVHWGGFDDSLNYNGWTPITEQFYNNILEKEAAAQNQYKLRVDKLTGQPRVINKTGNVPDLQNQRLDDWDRNQRTWADNKQGDAWYLDNYKLLDLPVGKSIKVDMNSADFDTFLRIIDLNTNKIVANSGDLGGSNSSSITFLVEPSHKYEIFATSAAPDLFGKYSLSVNIL
jgi:V8-like Glu-specific endopeptidase